MQQRPDEFESISESAPLVDELRDRIRATGPITFRAFMQDALYHPRYGYYTRHAGAMNRGGDYVTSPEVHSIFGALVAKQLAELWRTMGEPPRFDIVEQGAGTGKLAHDILRWAEAQDVAFASALRYRIVEVLPAARGLQEQTIAGTGDPASRVEWHSELPHGIEGCVLSNELPDSFPIHRVVREGGELREVYVRLSEDDRFEDRLGPLSDSALARYFDALGLVPGEGCYAEVNLDAPRWLASAARSIERGYVLTFDYGYEAADLYAPWRRDGTLLCFYRQTASSDPYQRIGKQDMTASIDFTTMRRAGEAAGLDTIGYTNQSAFLVRLGIGEGVAAIARSRPNELEEYFARRKVVLDLIDPGRLGRIKVLLQGKGVPQTSPCGFRDGA